MKSFSGCVAFAFVSAVASFLLKRSISVFVSSLEEDCFSELRMVALNDFFVPGANRICSSMFSVKTVASSAVFDKPAPASFSETK